MLLLKMESSYFLSVLENCKDTNDSEWLTESCKGRRSGFSLLSEKWERKIPSSGSKIRDHPLKERGERKVSPLPSKSQCFLSTCFSARSKRLREISLRVRFDMCCRESSLFFPVFGKLNSIEFFGEGSFKQKNPWRKKALLSVYLEDIFWNMATYASSKITFFTFTKRARRYNIY